MTPRNPNDRFGLNHAKMPEDAVDAQVKTIVDSSYCSFFDSEYMRRLESIGPLLLESK